METLIFNGSPRKNGDSMTLVNEIIKYLDGKVEIVHTYDVGLSHGSSRGISPCIDCRYCWNKPECCIDDGMQEIYRRLNEVDNVIIASPIYFSELTGPLLSFASRFQLYWVAKHIRRDKEFNLKKKNGALVISAGTDSNNLEERALKTAKHIFSLINTTSIGMACTMHTNNLPAGDDSEALRKARELALKLNGLHTTWRVLRCFFTLALKGN